MQGLFNDFFHRVRDSAYSPGTAEELLVSRLTAVRMMQSEDSSNVLAGEAFIQRTSQNPEADLARLREFSAMVTEWIGLEISSRYMRDSDLFLEYKLSVRISDAERLLHRHARYQSREAGFIFCDQTPPLVRVIGDPVLHQPGILFPIASTEADALELKRQIEIARSVLIATGGAGIAANQCAQIEKPYAFTIVGVFHENDDHRQRVGKRYPGVAFPEAVIMVNPEIIQEERGSHEFIDFNHACLSVPGYNKCCVRSPYKMKVQYRGSDSMELCSAIFEGTFSVALWHELNHILEGQTYIDTALGSLSEADFLEYEKMIGTELCRRKAFPVCADLTFPDFYFTIIISEDGVSRLNKDSLERVLSTGLTTDTLEGIILRCAALRCRRTKSSELAVEASLGSSAIERVTFLTMQRGELQPGAPLAVITLSK